MIISTNYDYSLEHILGWLSCQEQLVPSYSQLLSLATVPTVQSRLQALSNFDLFRESFFESDNWTSFVLEREYAQISQAFPAEYAEYFWLEYNMSAVRTFVRQEYSAHKQNQNTAFLDTIVEKLFQELGVPQELRGVFEFAFDQSKAQNEGISFASLELLLDKISVLAQLRYLEVNTSKTVRQWILLQVLLTWVKQQVRSATLKLPPQNWEDWFATQLTQHTFDTYEQLHEQVWQALSGSLEWAAAALMELADQNNLAHYSSEEIERLALQVNMAVIEHSSLANDPFLLVVRYLHKVRMSLQLAAFLTTSSVPSQEALLQMTQNYDL